MHIHATTSPTQRIFPEPALSHQENAHPPTRDKRAINSNPSQENSVSDNPEPDKNIETGQKVSVPANVGPNPSIDPVTTELNESYKTVSQEASLFLKKKFAEMAAKAQSPAEKEKWDIDPDNTFLVTFDYNTTGEPPYPAKVIKRISLTQALITNAQDTPEGKGYLVPYYPGGPEVIVKPDIKTEKPGVFDFPSRFNPNSEKSDITHTYQGIYIESAEEAAPVYNGGNQSSITPKEFKSLIWKADFQTPYTTFLDTFWSRHKEQYPTIAKASFAKSAMAQHQEGSLTAEGRDLAIRAAGLPDNQASWPDITYEQLQKNPPKDPNIEVGLLKLGNYQSTDLVYITDTKVKLDANGNKIPPLTLLYIPGNSSPIHSFSSQAEMKTWLAGQMADPVKREAMAAHFPLKDKPNGYAQAGIDETLAGLGTWPQKRETPGGLFSYDHRAFTGYWDPQDFITTEPSNLPFDEVARRQKDRSYADAATEITTDADVNKKNVLAFVDKAMKAALFLAPLALVMPEVEAALGVFYLTVGATSTGIGIDDKIKGKPKGNERIIFGVFNAASVVAPRIFKGGSAGEGVVDEVKPPRTIPEEEAVPPSSETTPSAPAPENEIEPHTNPKPGIESNEIKDYAVEDGEQLISGVTPNANGVYYVKGSRGEDRWLIKVSFDENTTRVFEIKSNFKLGSDTVEIIDPFTRKPVMTVRNTGDETWEAVRVQGGIKLPWQKKDSGAQEFDPGAYDYPTKEEPHSSKTTEKIDKRLKQDADTYHKSAKTKARPTLSDLPKNASQSDVIDTVYQKSPGMIIGEDHSQSAALRFSIDNAERFKANKVSTYYSEGFEHSLQPDLDKFFETGEFSPALRQNLKLIDRAHLGHEPYTNKNLLLTMRKNGIRVKAIDVPSAEPKTRRLKNMNFYASKVIEHDQAMNPGEKWVARVGSDHVFTYDGEPPVRGISELTGATGVSIDNAPSNTPTSITQSRDKTAIYIDLETH
ncbi:membrane-targeted effector domain-containing toxin [Pseudomonas sp. KBW05]|uniref:membrane-targeted effector domain-containing toxin n=1 Tax=Pseudomonas sp. KBW05 TaxID=2153360 RepID=UPI002114158A|nr:membrane-targeted effector domain-containing toxin [Pseudomonas sp. KBW05]